MGKALVAKSYIGLEQVSEVYKVGTKDFVDVVLKSGKTKAVRAYSITEYKKYYPELAAEADAHNGDPYWKSQKDTLGFKNGYITIFKGNTYDVKDWFKEHGCTYTRWWGWSFSSEVELPEDIPFGVTPIRLPWEKVGEGDNVFSDEKIKLGVDSIILDPDDSEYFGEVGDKIEKELTIEKIVTLEGYYGISTMYIMRDIEDNCFVWTTSASRDWEEGETYLIKGTIKKHDIYKNTKQTHLTRCRAAKK